MHFKFQILKVNCFALILLSAILSGAFSVAFFKSANHSSAEKVYCPLTKKMQPVNPPPNISPADLLNDICADDSEKDRLTLAIAENLKLKFSTFNQDNFENLAFDFWQKGNTAFENLPSLPNLPEKSLAKNPFSIIGYSENYETKLVWKLTEKFTFQLQPRPPTKLNFPAFQIETASNLKQISRRIAPRAPPFFV